MMNRRAFSKAALAAASAGVAKPYFSSIGGCSPMGVAAPPPGMAAWYRNESLPSSGPLATWADSSGNGLDATQATGSAQPTILSLNGMNHAYFQGTAGGARYLTIPAGLSFDRRNIAVFMVSQTSNENISGSGNPTSYMVNLGGSFQYTNLGSSTSTVFFRRVVPLSGTASTEALQTGFSVHGFVSSASALTFYQDGITSVKAAQTTTTLTGGTISDGTSPFVGLISEILIYIGITATQIDQVQRYLAAKFRVPFQPRQKLLVIDGDSNTAGYQTDSMLDYGRRTAQLLGPDWRVYNKGYSGHRANQTVTEAPSTVDPLYSASYQKCIYTVMLGTNDLIHSADTPATIYGNISSICSGRRAAGFTVGVLGILDQGSDPTRAADLLTVNASVRANWSTFADFFVDVGANSLLGVNPANANTTYFNADKLHMTNAGHGVMFGLYRSQLQAFI